MKKIYATLVLATLFIFSTQAQIQVTFQVDMNQQALQPAGVNTTDSVHVAGSFQGWDPAATAMSDPECDGIWTVTTSIANGTMLQYKFVNGNAWGSDETNVSACATSAGGNRGHTVSDPDGDGKDTIALVCFDQCVACPMGVTFRVDMSNETVDPAGVHVAGSFQGWDPAATPLVDQGNGVWQTTMMVPAGPIEFKYVNGNAWGSDETMIAGCKLSSNGNRGANLEPTTTLPLNCFDACTPCTVGPPPMYLATFRVDMSNMITRFGAQDSAYVAGSFQGWAAGDVNNALTDPDGDGIYEGTDSVVAGTSHPYKYLYGNEWGFDEILGTLPCQNGGNRSFTMPSMDTVFNIVCFETCMATCPALGTPINVTFAVDMSNEVVSAEGVFLKGDFQWPKFTDAQLPMTDADGDGIYMSAPIQVYPGMIQYKFVNGDGDNMPQQEEENFGFTAAGCGVTPPVGDDNRLVDLTGATMDTIIGAYEFNSCNLNQIFSGVNNTNAELAFSVLPNPFTSGATLTFNNPNALNYNLTMTNVSGKVMMAWENLTSGTFQLQREELSNGIYFLTLRNSAGDSYTQKVVLY